MADQSELWEKKADLLQRFLALTDRIAKLLESAGDDTESLREIEALIDERGGIISEVSKLLTPEAQAQPAASEREEKQRWLCGELLKQIQSAEEKNLGSMNRMLGDYKERMRSNRQSRDAIGAYGVQMQGSVSEGTIFNKEK